MRYLNIVLTFFLITSCNVFNAESNADENFSNNNTYTSPSLLYNTKIFTESTSGSIANQIDIVINSDLFTGSNGEDFIGTGKVTLVNIPAGLTAVLTRISSTKLTLTLSGAASNHAPGNNVSNITLQIHDNAFSSTPASGVNNSLVSDIAINFSV